MAFQVGTAINEQLAMQDISPLIKANALEQQAIVGLSDSVNKTVQGIVQKKIDKDEQEVRMSALSPLLAESGLAGKQGTDTFNAALKSLSKDDNVLAQIEGLTNIQNAKEILRLEEEELRQDALTQQLEPKPLLVTKAELDDLGAASVKPRVQNGEVLYEVTSQSLSKPNKEDNAFIQGLEKIGDSVDIDSDGDGVLDTRVKRMGTGSIEETSLIPEEPEATAFQTKFEEEAGKILAQYKLTDRAVALGNIDTYDDLIGQLESGELTTRGFTDYLPQFAGFKDSMQAALAPVKQDAVNRVMGVVFQSLRATLGAQFTQKEAERLVAAAYNPKLTVEQNLGRLRSAKKILEATMQAKDAYLKHAKDGKSLSSYEGPDALDVFNSELKNFQNEEGEGIGTDVDKIAAKYAKAFNIK